MLFWSLTDGGRQDCAPPAAPTPHCKTSRVGDVCDRPLYLKKKKKRKKTLRREFWLCLICYALLVMSVQHQQSEWLECRYSILFPTLYQGEWLDTRAEGERASLCFVCFFNLPVSAPSHKILCSSCLHQFINEKKNESPWRTRCLGKFHWDRAADQNQSEGENRQIRSLASASCLVF